MSQVAQELAPRLVSQENSSRLAALALVNGDGSTLEVDIAEVQRNELGRPTPGIQERQQHGAVAIARKTPPLAGAQHRSEVIG